MCGIKIILEILALIAGIIGCLLYFFSNHINWHLSLIAPIIWIGVAFFLWSRTILIKK